MIQDNGNRTEFETGAVRDVQKGKGRCDLLPLDIVSECLEASKDFHQKDPIMYIHDFQISGDYMNLIYAACAFYQHDCSRGLDLPQDTEVFGNVYTMILEYSIHLEEGRENTESRNWQKGIPLCNYISSAVRHYLKYERGDKDKRHDRAFVWNCLCGAWTAVNHPELNEYPIVLED